MVLVDASHPDQWTRIPEALGGRVVALSNRMLGLLSEVGLMRILDLIAPQAAAGLPPRQYAEMKALFAQPKMWSTSSAVLGSWNDSTRGQINGASPLGSLPLVVLSVTEQAQYAETLTKLQSELPTLSSNSIHRTVQGATHENLISRADNARLVTAAIRDVLESARTGQACRHWWASLFRSTSRRAAMTHRDERISPRVEESGRQGVPGAGALNGR